MSVVLTPLRLGKPVDLCDVERSSSWLLAECPKMHLHPTFAEVRELTQAWSVG